MKGFAMLGIGKVGWVQKNKPVPGDRVVVPAITPDWRSREIQDYKLGQHSGGMLVGWKFSNIKDGSFAEFFHVNDADMNLAILPDSISLQ